MCDHRRRDVGPPEHGDVLRLRKALDAHRVERDVDVAAEQRQQHHDEHVAGRHADLPVRVPQDPQLHDEDQEREREEEEAEQERERRWG